MGYQPNIVRHDETGDVAMTLVEVAELNRMRAQIEVLRDLVTRAMPYVDLMTWTGDARAALRGEVAEPA